MDLIIAGKKDIIEITKDGEDMSNILLARIDSRLIHGQITAQWVKAVDAKEIVVVNDEVANDAFRQGLMNMAAMDMKVTYKSVAEMIDGWQQMGFSLFLICENPEDVWNMIRGGVSIPKVNIGNMHMQEGKRQIAMSVAMDDKDIQCFKQMHDQGIELEIRRLPSTPEEDVNVLFE